MYTRVNARNLRRDGLALAALGIGLTFLALGCTPGPPGEETSPEVSESLYFEPIGSGQAGSIADTSEIVVRDSVAWRSLTQRLRTREPFRPVDFSQYMVFVVAMPQTTGGFRIQFQDVEKTARQINASYVVFAPGSDCLTVSALTLPYQAIAVRRAEGDVDFKRSVRWESCSIE